MDALLSFLKYFGLIVASIASLIGIISDFKKKGADGKDRITSSGKSAIALTLIGLIISGLSSFIQDRKDEQKATQQIIQENNKKFEELKRFQTQVSNLNEIRFQQSILSRKQDSIQRMQDSSQREQGKKLLEQQIRSSNYIFKQMLVDNYLQTIPEVVDLLIELPYDKRHSTTSIDSCRLTISWSSNYKERIKEKTFYFFIGGVIRSNEKVSRVLFVQKNNLGSTDKEVNDSNKIDISSSNNEFNKIAEKMEYLDFSFLNLQPKNNLATYLVIPLIGFDYVKPPWDKLIDFRNNNFSFKLINDKKHIEFTNMGGANKGFLRFDDKYLLRLPNYDFLGERKVDIAEIWKSFRDDIFSKISR